MNNHPRPQGSNDGDDPSRRSPWSQDDVRWQPQSYGESAGRDPHRPFGQAPPTDPPADLRHLAPPPPASRTKVFVVVGIVAAILALVLVLQFTGSFSSNEPVVNPSPGGQASSTGRPQPVATGGTSIPFEGNGTGTFEILKQTWGENGLTITYRITLDEEQGERGFSLYMFTNSTLEVADPVDPVDIRVTSGTPWTGTVDFIVERAKGTLVLASGFGAPLTALRVAD